MTVIPVLVLLATLALPGDIQVHVVEISQDKRFRGSMRGSGAVTCVVAVHQGRMATTLDVECL
jgi:hypothetical protein